MIANYIFIDNTTDIACEVLGFYRIRGSACRYSINWGIDYYRSNFRAYYSIGESIVQMEDYLAKVKLHL